LTLQGRVGGQRGARASLCTGSKVAIGITANGTREAFIIGSDAALHEATQNANGSWGAWTNLGGNCWPNVAVTRNAAGYLDVYHGFNMISPWMVGRISDNAGADWFYTNRTIPDLADCNAHGIDYQPCVIPGDLAAGAEVYENLTAGGTPAQCRAGKAPRLLPSGLGRA